MVAMETSEDLDRKRRQNIIDALDKRMEGLERVSQGLGDGVGPRSSGQNCRECRMF